ncbi:MAG: dihydroneopterin aldolase [Nitrospirae bacterium]|nr:dihydroneopterin aldolase [Nitrospirota bacterium]
MADHLIIERLEFQGHCGVTSTERKVAQPIGVDLELEYPPDAPLTAVAAADNIERAMDYARVAERILEIGRGQECCLLETLAERLCSVLFAEFPASRVRLWVRKLAPPVTGVKGSVGVRLDRRRAAQIIEPAPAKFLMEHVHLLPKGEVLDVAAGRGRNALYLASLGYRVEGIDRDEQALAELTATAQRRRLNLTMRYVDLEADPNVLPEFPKERYDVILVFFYLYRPLFPALLQALRPGGVLVYETFLIDNHLRHQHPRRKEFCLAHNELLRLTAGLRVLHYEEGEHHTAWDGAHGSEPAFTARLLARKE